MSEQDPEIEEIQRNWFDTYRHTERWIIVQDVEGYSVHQHGMNDVSPSTVYPTREAAAARLLQLLGIHSPVTPQAHPEDVMVGTIGVLGDPDGGGDGGGR